MDYLSVKFKTLGYYGFSYKIPRFMSFENYVLETPISFPIHFKRGDVTSDKMCVFL